MRRSVSIRGGRPPRSKRAIADCVVPTISASSRWENPFACRRSATLSATAAKNQPRSAVRIRSCSRSSGLLAGRAIADMLCDPLVELGAQALVEETAEEEDSSDREERQRALRRAEARQIEEEELAEADGEEDEPAPAQ
jgi:hypothetical protein